MKRISKLDNTVANQIAAGEVVERPASVVKELLENSLDAQADNIRIDIENGGIDKIRIIDNGNGIHHNDLILSVTPHATSKIASLGDLSTVSSLGFRGEALASIGSIAKICLVSKYSEDFEAKRIIVNGGIAQNPTDFSGDLGTTILVENLFYNVPVRKKFLKSSKTEIFHIDSTIKKVMLCSFNCRYQVYYEGKLTYNFPKVLNLTQKEKRIEKIFGKSFMNHAVSLEIETNGMNLEGWVSLPSLERRQSDWQYFYLNGRVIRDRLIQHAIRQAYSDKLDNNFQPAYVLYLTIDPRVVDVNVHPTKSEVRFQDSRYVHDFIVSCLEKVFAEPDQKTISMDSKFPPKTDFEYTKSTDVLTSNLYEIDEKKTFPLGNVIGLLKKKFALSENAEGLVIIDLRELYIQLFYLNIQNSHIEQDIRSLVIPETLSFDIRKAQFIERSLVMLEDFGIYLNILSNDTFVIRKSDKIYKDINFKQLLEDIFLLTDREFTKESLRVSLTNAVDKQCKYSQTLSVDEVNSTIRSLENKGCHHVSYRGAKIWRSFSLSQLAEFL